MKTIADFKRKMIKGSDWETIHQFKGRPLKNLGIRECSISQSNSFALRTKTQDGYKDSYCNWPKKSEFIIIDDNTIQINNGWVTLRYTLIPEKIKLLNKNQVEDIEKRQSVIDNWLKVNKTNRITVEQQKLLPTVTNQERSDVELYYWHVEKPLKYFLYINEKKKKATTFTGEKLGDVYFGKPYKDNFGGVRQSIDIQGLNGVKYHGRYFKSAGDYARIKAYKNQESL